MLIVIRTGRDRKEHKKWEQRWKELCDRVAELEGEIGDHEHDDYATSDELINTDLAEEYAADVTRLQEQVRDLDFWKADRNHSHEEQQT